MATTIPARRRYGPQLRRRPLHLECAQVVQRAFPELPGGATRYSISRARNGNVCNPVYRLAGWFDDARAAGMSSRPADEVISYLKIRRDEVWAGERLCYHTESYREQVLDGEENLLQLRAVHERAAIPAYVEKLDQYIAQAKRLRRAAVAEYEAAS